MPILMKCAAAIGLTMVVFVAPIGLAMSMGMRPLWIGVFAALWAYVSCILLPRVLVPWIFKRR